MKIRNPKIIAVAALLSTGFTKAWMRTVRSHYVPVGANFDPRRKGLQGRYLYVFWHEYMILPSVMFARKDIYVLTSRHADGQFTTGVLERFGYSTIRGSTNRGGVTAARQMVRCGQVAHLAITPDGPRGPRRQVQPGVTFLASRVGLPIVPFGVGYERPWRLKSWDRLAIPRPFSRGVVVTTDPILIPADANRETLEVYRGRVEAAIERATALAEHWAANGVPPTKTADHVQLRRSA